MSEASLVRLLVFRVGNLACAAEVDQVREILPRLPTTRIPGAPPVVAGLVNVRGTLVTVVEGTRALGQPASPPDVGSTVLIEVGAGKRLVGFTVDEVTDLLVVPSESLEQRTALAGVDPTLVRAVGRRGDQVVVVLEVDALLGPILTTQGREQ